jgi:hypothetical protein
MKAFKCDACGAYIEGEDSPDEKLRTEFATMRLWVHITIRRELPITGLLSVDLCDACKRKIIEKVAVENL